MARLFMDLGRPRFRTSCLTLHLFTNSNFSTRQGLLKKKLGSLPSNILYSIAKSPNHHCNWWKDPALSQPLKSSESSRSRVKQAMEKPQPCALSNCPFLFLVGEFQKLASRNRKCIESVLRTHTYMRARKRARTEPDRAAPLPCSHAHHRARTVGSFTTLFCLIRHSIISQTTLSWALCIRKWDFWPQ